MTGLFPDGDLTADVWWYHDQTGGQRRARWVEYLTQYGHVVTTGPAERLDGLDELRRVGVWTSPGLTGDRMSHPNPARVAERPDQNHGGSGWDAPAWTTLAGLAHRVVP